MKWEPFCESIQTSTNPEDLMFHIESFAVINGFSHVSYIAHIPCFEKKPRQIHFSNIPEYQFSAEAKGYRDDEYVVRYGRNSIEPLIWSERVFKDSALIGINAQRLGLTSGVSQPCWAARGVFGILTLLRGGREFTDEEITTLRRPLRIVGNLLHLSMFEYLDIDQFHSAAEISLTFREREILRWTSEGKTAVIIGNILCISPRTVNFHISNVLAKLAAANKTEAVSKARSLGIL
jgi:LuxR family transcriptional regulator/LuxR family quorum-sensing system transcriptional regulator SolR